VKVLETDRLVLRRLTIDDAAFILEHVNEPSWLQFIGDRGVRTLDDARAYISNGPIAMYEQHGFGLYLTELKGEGVPIGTSGLIKRKGLEDVDIGFALLPAYWAKGYAYEAASAVMEHGKRDFGLERIVGIVSSNNQSSIKLLVKLGLKFERMIQLPGDTEEIKLFAWDVRAGRA
jgi:RimJ/RimL family protein N-acetyltransferase